jgi:AmmeMemoRadiSam system protein B
MSLGAVGSTALSLIRSVFIESSLRFGNHANRISINPIHAIERAALASDLPQSNDERTMPTSTVTTNSPSLRARPAAVAGSFYPKSDAALSSMVDALLVSVSTDGSRHLSARPKALLVPHAGFVYSGPIAASGYKRLRPYAHSFRRVVLLGPAHRVYVRSVAVPSVDAFVTPLGHVPIDHESIAKILETYGDAVVVDDLAHAPEHSLEVQLPFLQRVLHQFTIVPLLVGDASSNAVGAVVESLWGEDETLFIISSDLSHYLPHDAARALDAKTVEQIANLDRTPIAPERACGAYPINGFLEVARRKRLHASILDVRNSGDTSGDRERVVGYTSIQFISRESTP